MSKDLIRQQIKELRKSISESESIEAGERALKFLQPWLSRPTTWLLYSPVQGEISTLPLFRELVSRGRKIGFPKIDGETLAFHQIQNLNELTPGRLSLEPKSSALKISETSGVIVVPAVAFSRDGHRLGFGRGFYDRFLNQFPHFIRLGFAYDFQVSLQGFQSESHDEIMDFIICPSGVWGSSRTCF